MDNQIVYQGPIDASDVFASPMLAAYLYDRSLSAGKRQNFDPWHDGLVAGTAVEVRQMIGFGAGNRAGFDRRRYEQENPDVKAAYDKWEADTQVAFDIEYARRKSQPHRGEPGAVYRWGKKKGQPIPG